MHTTAIKQDAMSIRQRAEKKTDRFMRHHYVIAYGILLPIKPNKNTGKLLSIESMVQFIIENNL